MWNWIKKVRRRSWVPRKKYARLGVTGAFAVIALAIIFITGWLLDRRGASRSEQALIAAARAADGDPVTAIANASRANRMVFLSDIHTSAATKALAADAIEKIVATSGLDLVVLEVGSDQQPVIDRYLEQTQEDASILMTNGRTLREPGPATRSYLEIYRVVWRLNQKLGADERIRIIAADLEGWPPARPLAPAELARKSAEREAHMQKQVNTVVSRNPGARVLIFMTGFHALKNGFGQVQTGGTAPVAIAWLAGRLAEQFPEEVYSFLVDASASGTSTDVTTYAGTRIASLLQRGGVNRTFATSIPAEFDQVRQPLVIRKSPGLSFEIKPRDYSLSSVADAYIHLD